MLDEFFGQYGPYVLAGCEVSAAGDEGVCDVASGLVVLAGKDHSDKDVTMVVPFAGATDVSLPLYLTLDSTVRSRRYVTGGVKPIAYDYYTEASAIEPAEGVPFLLLNEATPRFVDVIQDEDHQFITGADRKRWDGKTTEEWVKEFLKSFDLTAVGEIRRFSAMQPFDNPKYLLCDGSIINPEDYPDLNLAPAAPKLLSTTGVPPISNTDVLKGRRYFPSIDTWIMVYRMEHTGGFVPTDHTVLISTDGEQTWKKSTITAYASSADYSCHVNKDGHIFIGTCALRVLSSTTTAGLAQIYRSIDGGESFQQVYVDTVNHTNIVGFIDSPDGNTITAYGTNILTSFDGGETWTKVALLGSSYVPSSRVSAIYNNNRLIISSGTTIATSDDFGTTFASKTVTLAGAAGMYDLVAIDDNTIIFSSDKGGMAISKNNGDTFQNVTAPSSSSTSSGANAFPIIGQGVILWWYASKLYRSADLGNTWTLIPTTGQLQYGCCFHDCFLLSSGIEGQSISSIDGGQTWWNTSGVLGGDTKFLQVYDNRIFYGAARNICIGYFYPSGFLPNLMGAHSKYYIKAIK